MAGTVVPATGLGWDTDIPDNAQPHGNDYNEHRETKKAVDIRIKKEHVAFGAGGVGGEHKAGSAKIFTGDYSSAAAGDALPTKRPDGTTDLNADDAGRLAYDTDATYGGVLYRWSGSAWEALGVMLTGNQTVAGVKTFSSFPVTPSSAPTTDYQTANKKYVDDQIAANAKSFGSLSSVAPGTAAAGVTATEDGFVIAYLEGTNIAQITAAINGVTVLISENLYAYSSPNKVRTGLTLPVKAGETWKITVNNGTPIIRWRPITGSQ